MSKSIILWDDIPLGERASREDIYAWDNRRDKHRGTWHCEAAVLVQSRGIYCPCCLPVVPGDRFCWRHGGSKAIRVKPDHTRTWYTKFTGGNSSVYGYIPAGSYRGAEIEARNMVEALLRNTTQEYNPRFVVNWTSEKSELLTQNNLDELNRELLSLEWAKYPKPDIQQGFTVTTDHSGITITDDSGDIVFWNTYDWVQDPNLVGTIVESLKMLYEGGPITLRMYLKDRV
jgi:hypothetical protein